MAPTATNNELKDKESQPGKYIGDLDLASPSRGKKLRRDLSINNAIVYRTAKVVAKGHENEDSEVPETLESVVKLAYNEEEEVLGDGPLYIWKHEPATVKEIVSLCGVELSDSYPQDEYTNSLSNSEKGSVAKNLAKTWKSSGKGKKRKIVKGSTKKKSHKRQRKESWSMMDESLLMDKTETHNLIQNIAHIKTVANPTQTAEKKGGCVRTQQSPRTGSNGAMCSAVLRNCRNGRGDGGDDDGDDSRKPPRKPPDYTECGGNKVVPKRKKKKAPSAMEIGFSGEASSSEMDTDCRRSSTHEEMPSASDEQNSMSEHIHHEPAVVTPQELHQEPQQNFVAQVPNQQPEAFMQQLRMEIIKLNSDIQHHNFCKTQNCKRCQIVVNVMKHNKEQNSACRCSKECQLWPHALEFHRNLCNFHSCKVCKKKDSKENVVANPVLQAQIVQQNDPTVPPSLDLDDVVVYKSESFDNELTHFKENKDYIKTSYIAKGATGNVHCVEVDAEVKQKYCDVLPQNLVVKQVAKVDEDEKYVFHYTWLHPSFVQTYFVTQNTSNFNIFMEKCEMTVKDYINQLLDKGKQLELWEVMFYWTQTADALKHLHHLRIPVIYKDIKAENVLLTIKDNLVRVKLGDFDTVKRLHNEYTQRGLSLKGTHGLVSPEVLRRETHGRPADVWNLAMFLLQLLFPREFMQLQGKLATLCRSSVLLYQRCAMDYVGDFIQEYVPRLERIDSALAHLIMSCLREEPSERPTVANLLQHSAVRRYLEMDMCMEQVIDHLRAKT